MEGEKDSDLAVYRRVFSHARPCWRGLLGLLVLGLLSAPIALLGPVPLKIAIDNGLGERSLPPVFDQIVPAAFSRTTDGMIGLAAILLVLVALISQLQDLFISVVRTNTAERLVLRFRARLFRHIQQASLSYHDSRGSADSLYRISQDAPALQYVTIDGAIPLVTAMVTLVAILWVTLRLDWQLAVVGLSISPVLFLISSAYRKRLRSEYREVKRLESSALSVVQETFGALRVVKAFGQEAREEARFLERAGQGMRARIRIAFTEGGFGLLSGLTTAVGTAVTLYIGARHVQAGDLTIGGLLLVMSYLAQLYGPLSTISRKVTSVQGHLASLERTFQLLDEAPEVPEAPHPRGLRRATGDIAFEDVSFAYAPGRDVLRHVSFAIPPGARLGISGTTGSGKTTLVNLLMRFYDPQAGRVRLDGVDVRDYRLADLRAQFALVLQEPVLFSTTIAENIAYARPDATREEIVAAAEAANAHAFITRLPQGYDTLVGERGMQLSGGERQRISIARAFLKDAPILILDEPTSSVDSATEAAIMGAMERLMSGRTTLMIAHRLSTLDDCDYRLRIEKGQAVQLERWRHSPELPANLPPGGGVAVVTERANG